MDLAEILSVEMNHPPSGIRRTISLFDEGNSLHFIARYRKDQTGGLEAEQLLFLQKRLTSLRKLDEARTKAILRLQELNSLSEALQRALDEAESSSEVDEIMKPYRSKRETRASLARDQGCQIVADVIMGKSESPLAQVLHNFENGIDVISLAKDIIAEESINFPQCHRIAEEQILKTPIKIDYNSELDPSGRYESLKQLYAPLGELLPHQIHALFRAIDEKVVSLTLKIDQSNITHQILGEHYFKPPREHEQLYREGLDDGISRLLLPRARRSSMSKIKEKADLRSIEVFKENLENLLLQSPSQPSVIMAIDPGFKSGCKIAVINEQGILLDTATIFPTPPVQNLVESTKIIEGLLRDHKVKILALGNGTASQEVREYLKRDILGSHQLEFMIIPEDGASVYSASKSAQDEFPDLESGARGAISLARRILDPLGEFVKIDPKSLGVGQYQHDVNQKTLTESLAFVVERCINQVGIDVSTSSSEALQYISGLNLRLAQKIVDFRTKEGIRSLVDILGISGIGKVTFDQAVGFLRLPSSVELLDSTLIHYDHYEIARSMLQEIGVSIEEWSTWDVHRREKKVHDIDKSKYVQGDIGPSLIQDIISELVSIGFDPRGNRVNVEFDDKLTSITDLKEGKVVSGVVRNVVDFGAFVDLGIKENGLIHVSKLSKQFIKNIHSVIRVNDRVKAEVLDVDISKKRISLRLIELNDKTI